MKKIQLRSKLKVFLLIILISLLCYVFVPWGYQRFMRGLNGLMISPKYGWDFNRIYYTQISGLTYINGNFLLFVNKPYMFQSSYGYIYASKNARDWKEVARINNVFGGSDSNNIKTFLFPISIQNKCIRMLNLERSILVSSNCRTNWKEITPNIPKINVWVSNHTINDGLPHCNTLLTYESSLIYVFSNQPPKIKGYDVVSTTQLIPNYAVLYQTFNGVDWKKLITTESVINNLILKNYLKPNKLLSRFTGKTEKYSELDRLIPIVYDLPCKPYPENNMIAYEKLVNVVKSNNLSIILDKRLTTYGSGVYIGVFKNQQNHYSFISSTNGKDYTISEVPTNIVYSLAGFIYKTY